MSILEFFANLNILGNQWNIFSITMCIVLGVFTHRKIRPKFSRVGAAVISCACIMTYIAVIDLLTLPVYIAIYGFNYVTYFTMKAQQIFTAFIGVTLVYYLLRSSMRISKITIVALCFEFIYNMPISAVTGVTDYRALPDPLRSYYYLAFYIPAMLVWALGYIGLWKHEEQTK